MKVAYIHMMSTLICYSLGGGTCSSWGLSQGCNGRHNKKAENCYKPNFLVLARVILTTVRMHS